MKTFETEQHTPTTKEGGFMVAPDDLLRVSGGDIEGTDCSLCVTVIHQPDGLHYPPTLFLPPEHEVEDENDFRDALCDFARKQQGKWVVCEGHMYLHENTCLEYLKDWPEALERFTSLMAFANDQFKQVIN
jgi:hypothetical protein